MNTFLYDNILCHYYIIRLTQSLCQNSIRTVKCVTLSQKLKYYIIKIIQTDKKILKITQVTLKMYGLDGNHNLFMNKKRTVNFQA